MKIETEGLQLYHVNFNNSDNMFMSGSLPSYYVMATTYDEAVYKAEKKFSQNPSNSIIGSDGSLKFDNNDPEPKVRVIKLISDEIVW